MFKSYPTHLQPYCTLTFSSQVPILYLAMGKGVYFSLCPFQIISTYILTNFKIFQKTDYMLTSNYYKKHCIREIKWFHQHEKNWKPLLFHDLKYKLPLTLQCLKALALNNYCSALKKSDARYGLSTMTPFIWRGVRTWVVPGSYFWRVWVNIHAICIQIHQ